MKIDNPDVLNVPEQWHNIRAFYIYAGTPENPQLILDFKLEIATYQPSDYLPEQTTESGIPGWQKNAFDDKEKFTSLNFQLNQTADSVTELAEKIVSIFLINSLLESEKNPLSPEDAQSFRDFIADCLVYVTNRADNQDGGTQPVCRLQIPVSPKNISASELIKLSLRLSFEAREIADKETTPASTVSAEETSDEQIEYDIEDLIILPQSIDIFAAAFDSVFCQNDWQLRLGRSAVPPNRAYEHPTGAVWAVRMGSQPDTGYYYKIENQAAFYAPKPFARTLQSGTVPIKKYSRVQAFPDEKVLMPFSGVDLSRWSNEVFSVIDRFLSTAPAKVNSFLPDNPEIEINLDKIRRHKQAIAEAFAGTLTPIFNSNTNDEISRAAAREKFRQALIEQLSNAFIINAVTVFKVSGVSADRHKFYGTLPPRFYGELLASDAPPANSVTADSTVDETSENYSLSDGKIEYFKAGGAPDGDWRLPFLFASRNPARQTALSIPLAFRLTHLEYPIINPPEIHEDEQSSWIKFVNAPPLTPIGGIEFPVILFELPAPPATKEQAANSSAEQMKTEDLAVWDYSFSCLHQTSAQDYLETTIILNEQTAPASSAETLHPLFAPLAEFVTVYNDILTDFEKSTGEPGILSNVTSEDLVNAKRALEAFEQIVETVAVGFNQWINSSPEAAIESELPVSTRSFEIILERGANGRARIDVLGSISDFKVPPVIEIDSSKATPAADKPASSIASYNYVLPESPDAAGNESNEPKKYLSYEDALDIPERTVILQGLNVFTTQNVRGQIRVVRNGNIESGSSHKISDLFNFLSSPAEFAAPLTPAVRFADYDLGRLEVASPTLENYFNAFFGSLLKEAAGTSLFLKMTVSFSFDIAATMTDSPRAILPVAMLPVDLTVPQTGEPLPLVSALAKVITDWTKWTQPALGATSEYNIQLEIFGAEINGQTTRMPLLAIDNLYIRTGKIISA